MTALNSSAIACQKLSTGLEEPPLEQWVSYEIDVCDWLPGCDKERDRCENELGEWFDNLSFKTQLAIYYAQRMSEYSNPPWLGAVFDPLNGCCPWINMLREAENRIFTKNTKHFTGANTEGFILSLTTIQIHYGWRDGRRNEDE